MTITINVENEADAPDALRIIAEQIEEGYTSGFVGCSCDTWSIEK